MRALDQAECRALGLDPYTALAKSRERSECAKEVWREGELLGEWGWRTDNVLLRCASVWLLTFEPVERHKVFFARESLRLCEVLLTMFQTIRCEVWGGHEVALRWLAWLGFDMELIYTSHLNETFIIMKKEAPRGDAE